MPIIHSFIHCLWASPCQGAEYEILPALLASGAWCGIHTITSEFHPRAGPGIDSNEREYIKNHIQDTSAFFQKRICPTVFSSLDSEKFYQDTPQGIEALRAMRESLHRINDHHHATHAPENH